MKKNFYKKVLKNGMTILFEKRDLPVVSVAFAVKQGGINEDPSEKGISHFIEHMMYKGTPTRNNKQIAHDIEKNGGKLNGFTDEAVTAYWCKMPSKHLNLALEVMGDMIQNPLFDKKEIEKERQVIFEEIKMRRDTPQIHVSDEIQSCLYSGTIGLSLIGTEETMKKIGQKELRSKFKKTYAPNNIILCVVGDADFNEIVKFAEKNFSNEQAEVIKPKIKLQNKSKVETRKGIDQANMILAYHAPLAHDKKVYASQILNTILASGMSSRLFEEIREKRNLAYAILGDSNINKNYSYNLIYVGTTKENVDQVKELILKEFEKVSKELTEQELDSAKEQLIGHHQISMENSNTQIMHLLFSELNGNAEEFYDFEKNISKVKLEDVKNLAKLKDYSFFALIPEA
ncbi:insulinase family protein [Candidatus Pacearchaeota archaeon]|nr:insulinase family protein [Candidatus Pacearchaeota archaeon]